MPHPLRPRLLALTDRLLAGLLVLIILGASIAFGGAVWWWRPVLAILTTLLVALGLFRLFLQGSWPLRKSPLPWLGALAILLALAQLTPLPSALARRISSESWSLHAKGVPSGRALVDDPSADLPLPSARRTPLTVDRSATLRWAIDAALCLALFLVVARFADRLGHLYVVAGSVVAAFAICTGVGLVQLLGGASGLFGLLVPGQSPFWAPSSADLLATPNVTALRLAGGAEGLSSPWAVSLPDRPFFIASLMGGPGAYLALGALGLPLALTLALQLLAPRGSREGLRSRLQEGQLAGPVALLLLATWLGAGLVGALAGPILAVPFALGLLIVGLPGAWASGLRWSAVGLTVLAVSSLGLGVLLGQGLGRPAGVSPLADPAGYAEMRRLWAEAVVIVRDFPLLGSGLGTFSIVFPSYKSADASPSTAWSSLLQWLVEAGLAGAFLLVLALGWCLIRLKKSWRKVGSADRALASGLIGVATCFILSSLIHWTIQLPAVAIAASAFAGLWDRWLAGGTDLFVERT
ncbi:hypothetical protein BH23PLA1_BH23PLA1_08210 [soil metagenome]